MSHHPVKVLHIMDKLNLGGSTLHGGAQVLALCVPRFDKANFEVKVCSLRPRDSAGRYLEGLGIPMFYSERNRYDPRLLTDLAKLVKREQSNIVHLHGYGATTLGRFVAFGLKVPSIVHEHMYDQNIPAYQRWIDRLLGPKTSAGIAVSESVREFLVSFRGIPAEKVSVIYNGASLEKFDEKSTAGTGHNGWLKSKLGIPVSNKLVAIVGRLHPVKGHKYFLAAAKEVLQTGIEVTFLVVGDGSLSEELQKTVEQLGIGKSVKFLGHCSNVPSLLQQINVKVIASLSEGVPLTAFEAMAAGCAIVSTTVGGLPEIFHDHQTACLVPPQNAHAIAEKVEWLLSHEMEARAMGKRAQKAAQQYDIGHTVRQIEACYRHVLAGSC